MSKDDLIANLGVIARSGSKVTFTNVAFDSNS
jgi:HSP90 family molecular chaperone